MGLSFWSYTKYVTGLRGNENQQLDFHLVRVVRDIPFVLFTATNHQFENLITEMGKKTGPSSIYFVRYLRWHMATYQSEEQ